MCLALTGRVVTIGKSSAASLPGVIELSQRRREVDLIMTPEVEVGDYVVIHSGYAIRVVPDGFVPLSDAKGEGAPAPQARGRGQKGQACV